MKITEVQIKVIKPKDGLVGFASLVLEDCLYLSSIGIHTKLNGTGYRITYPTKKVGTTDLDIFHPINKAFGEELEKEILNKATKIFEAANI